MFMKHSIVFGLAVLAALAGRGAEPLSTLCTGTAPTISVPAAWTDGETVSGDTPLAVATHSLTGDTVTVTVDGLAATFSGGGGTFRWQPWTSGTHTLTHTAGTAVWTLRVSGTQSVAGLPAGAFRDCTNLVSVTLPKGVTAKGAWTFAGCPNLARVDAPTLRDWFAVVPADPADTDANPLSWGATLYVDGIPVRLEGPRFDRLVIPEGVTQIPAGAFHDCPDIVSVKIPNSVTDIGSEAFSGCSGLTSVTIPPSVTSIGGSAFEGCSGLTSVAIPSSVTNIGTSAFSDCSRLAGVTIPDRVTHIGDSAFSGCTGLTEVMVPSGVVVIGWGTFRGCANLSRVTVPASVLDRGFANVFDSSLAVRVVVADGIARIAASAFSGCTGLSEVTIPPGVTSIGASAFRGCNGLTNVVIPDGVTGIGSSAFQNCGALERIVFPAGLEQVGVGAFAGCTRLTHVEAPTLAAWLAVSFDDRDANPLAQGAALYLGGSASPLERLVIPDGTARLGRYAFAGYTNLVSVTLPVDLDWYESVFGFSPMALGTDWSTDGTLDGQNVYRSNPICDSQTTDLTFRIPPGMEKIVFSWKIDSESNYDWLTYYLDGVQKGRISGKKAWDAVTVGLDGSEHVLKFVYSKDGSASSGLDCGWVSIQTKSKTLSAFIGCSSIQSVTLRGDQIPLSNLFPDAYQNLSEVIILPGTENLVSGFMAGCSVASRVSLPDGLVNIGERAFMGCTGLKDVDIPPCVTNIGVSAFSGCTGLAGIMAIPSGVTSIGASAFFGCSGLTGVTIPPSVADIGDSAFEGCTGLAGDLVVPDGVTSIGWNAFAGCTGLSYVKVPACVVDRGFANVFGSDLAARVEVSEGVQRLGDGAFADCASLVEVVLPPGLADVSPSAFRGCAGLRRATLPAAVLERGVAAVLGASSVTNVVLAADVRRIPASAFEGCTSLARVSVPDGVASVGARAFAGCAALEGLALPASVAHVGASAFEECASLREMDLPAAVANVPAGLFAGCTALARVSLPSGATGVGDRAFLGCSSLRGVDVPARAVSVGESAFEGCSSLAGVSLPARVKRVGARAFAGCARLREAALPPRVTEVADGTFEGCSSLARVSLPEGVARVGEGAFRDCASLASLVLPSGLSWIGPFAFEGCASLEALDVPAGVPEIGASAFAGCARLARVSLPAGLASVGASAFEGCRSLAALALPAGVSEIGPFAFAGCSALASFALPDGIREIQYSTFEGCSALARVSFPAGLEEIGDDAFSGCAALASLSLSRWLRSVGASAFEGCASLTSLDVPDGVEWIGPRAFADCASLVRVAIPAGVEVIGTDAFAGCGALADLSVDPANPWYAVRDGLLLARNGTELVRGVDGDVVVPAGVEEIADGAFSGSAGMTGVALPPGLRRVGARAFEGCAGLASATLPDGVREVGARAFADCTGLVHIWIPEGVESIGEGAFAGCTSLAYVEIPASVTNVGARAFAGCASLAEIAVVRANRSYAARNGMLLTVDGRTLLEGVNGDAAVPDGVETVAAGAFAGRSGLAHVSLPASVRTVGAGAFAGCAALAEIAVDPANGSYASRDGMLLTADGKTLVAGVNGDVAVPDDVEDIAEDAFAGRVGLVGVSFPASVASVPASAFDGCGALAAFAVDPANAVYSSRGGLLLSKDGRTLVRGVNGDVAVPDGVEAIAPGAFAGLGGLVSVTVPEGVLEIGEGAFRDCASLARVSLPRRFEGALGPDAFAGCPAGLAVAYRDAARVEGAVTVAWDAARGSVAGAGTYAAGRTVTLKATAKRGWVFAGWTVLSGPAWLDPDARQAPSLSFAADGADVALAASFIPAAEDWAAVDGDFPAECVTGASAEPVALAVTGGSLAAVKVAGLPAGMKFTAKPLTVKATKTAPGATYAANTVYGTPTKSGVYTVVATATTAGRAVAVTNWTVVVRKPGERAVVPSFDAARGTVSGGCVCAPGKKVALKATAKKGYVFAGWTLAGASLPAGADAQAPSLSLVAGTSDIAAHAAFIPVEEDWAEISGTLPAECAKGAAIRPATLAARGGSLVAVKVTGLPAGLKFTAKPLTVKATKTAPAASYPANTVYGTPTRSGVYTVAATATTAGRATAATNWTVVVRGPGERVVRTACDAAHGKVSGAGVYAKGKKATLKATAGKGFAFAGWELEGVDLPAGADARDPSLALAVGESDVTARARFVPAGEDGTLALLVDGAEVPEDGSARFRDAGAGFALEAVSASLPKVALSGLPRGLKYDAKAGRIAGRGTKPGLYTVTAKLSNATVRRAVARTFRIEVPNLRDADALLRDGLANAPGEAYRAYVGVRPAGLPSLVPADPAHAKSLKVSGLPAGLKFDAKAVAAGEAALAGVPSKAGAYTVSVAVAGKTSTFTLEVLPLPDWAVGTFTGYFDETGADGTALRGTAAFTVSAAGKVSAKLVRQDGKAASWTHACLDRAEADAAGGVSFRVDAVVGGFRCEVSISAAAREGGPAQGVLAGTRRPVDAEDAGEGVVGLAFDCVQNLWGRGKALEGLAAKLKGRKVALPTIRDEQGNTYDVSLAFGAGGAVTAKYRLNGGAAQSASGTLAYRGTGELEAGGGDGEDGEGKTEQVAGSSVSLYLNLVRGGRAFLEVGLLVDGEGVVHWVDGRVAGDGEP